MFPSTFTPPLIGGLFDESKREKDFNLLAGWLKANKKETRRCLEIRCGLGAVNREKERETAIPIK